MLCSPNTAWNVVWVLSQCWCGTITCSKTCLVAPSIRSILHGENCTSASAQVQFQRKINELEKQHVLLCRASIFNRNNNIVNKANPRDLIAATGLVILLKLDSFFLPGASFGFLVFRCLRLCVSVCLPVLYVNHLVFRAITRNLFKLGSPNLDQRC